MQEARAGWPERVDAMIFDMDGTLVDSRYDWAAIRAELGVDAPSLIDALNALDPPERDVKWGRLAEIERLATAGATLHAGARSLLELLRERRIRTALVTNNSAENAARLRQRFDLRFDLVLTRDDGYWKPSSAPVMEAIRRLGVQAEHCLKVGDSRYDASAARDAGCGGLVILHDERGEIDSGLKFPTLRHFLAYLRQVL